MKILSLEERKAEIKGERNENSTPDSPTKDGKSLEMAVF